MEIDIVVPVWNRPVETRSCLVSLIDHSPGARFILIDNGSDRETERLLQDFAEALDDRALLLCTGANIGPIKALNLGLEKVDATFSAVVRNTCRVSAGWLGPLARLAEERPDAGLFVPSLSAADIPARKARAPVPSLVREAATGSLAAMVIRKALYDRIGGFDQSLDGDYWCIRDYCRRAYATAAPATGGSLPIKRGNSNGWTKSLRPSGKSPL